VNLLLPTAPLLLGMGSIAHFAIICVHRRPSAVPNPCGPATRSPLGMGSIAPIRAA